MRQHRLPAQDRRQAIVEAVRDLFAEKGFDGVTTRELARAAGVSEALLYRHFPSKESLYAAMCESCLSGRVAEEYREILALEPSASTLVVLTHFLVSKTVLELAKEKRAMDILVVRSLLDNGDFVRAKHRGIGSAWHRKFKQSLAVAARAGETRAGAPAGDILPWLVQSLVFGLMLYLRPGKPVIDVELPRAELVESCVRFILWGVGMKDEVIRKHYNPKALALLSAA